MKKHNIFISFEGGEGSGKTTVAKLVKEKLESKDIDVFLTREPGGSGLEFAEDVREIIMKHNDIDPITELLLFEASRREHIVKKVIPNLEKGNLVISDRFSDSTMVYQGMVKGIDSEIITSGNNIAVGKFYPSLVFIFDIDPKIGAARISKNDRKTNRFDNEGLKFHEKIRQGYLELYKSNKKKYILIDASKTPNEISERIIETLMNYNNG